MSAVNSARGFLFISQYAQWPILIINSSALRYLPPCDNGAPLAVQTRTHNFFA